MTTPVTLTLPEAGWAGDTVTVSHRPRAGVNPSSAFFRDFAVTVNTTNNRPTATVADESHLAQNAPPNLLLTDERTSSSPTRTSRPPTSRSSFPATRPPTPPRR